MSGVRNGAPASRLLRRSTRRVSRSLDTIINGESSMFMDVNGDRFLGAPGSRRLFILRAHPNQTVTAGLVPATQERRIACGHARHGHSPARAEWVPGTRPGMTAVVVGGTRTSFVGCAGCAGGARCSPSSIRPCRTGNNPRVRTGYRWRWPAPVRRSVLTVRRPCLRRLTVGQYGPKLFHSHSPLVPDAERVVRRAGIQPFYRRARAFHKKPGSLMASLLARPKG
jgi:hypothetical protein